MQRPANSALCGTCRDPFGIHFETYDGSQAGCRRLARDQRDDDCYCKGFAIVQRWGLPATTTPGGDRAHVQEGGTE